MILEYVIQWKTHMRVRNNKRLNKRFLVLPIGLAQVLLVIMFSGSYDIVKYNDSRFPNLRISLSVTTVLKQHLDYDVGRTIILN